MRWLYRLQNRLGLTGPEGTALLVLSAGLALGLGVREMQRHDAPDVTDLYAVSDAAFTAAAQPTPSSPLALTSAPAEAELSPEEEAPADSAAVEVPEAVEAVPAPAEPRRRSSRKPPPEPTNLNTASAEQLQRLPGVGPAISGRIVEYRNQHGPFRQIAQIQEVKGIGPKTFEKMRPWLRL